MRPYTHTVRYYETDRMGITHHSNYIRWMEEARLDLLEQLGWGWDRLEEEGISSPVTAIDCRYRASTTFPDRVDITVSVSGFTGTVLKLSYLMTGKDGKTVFEGSSEHCFMNGDGKILRLKKDCPALYELLVSLSREAEIEEEAETASFDFSHLYEE